MGVLVEASESQELGPGVTVGGKYQIQGTLGSGGTAVVFSATQSDLERLVAIKVIRRELMERPDAVSRLMSEATTVAQIKGEHAARILDVGQLDDGCPYIVMEHFDGNDLAALLRIHGPAPYDRVVDWVLQASVAIAEAHSLGTIHRDLKPQNIFLANTPKGEPMVKVLDFGISAAMSRRQTEGASTGEFKRVEGSPLYMSPEQMQGLPQDERSDIWGLGVLMFELLTQGLPFPGDTLEEISGKALNGEAPLQALTDANVPAALVAVIGRCLSRTPEDRYPGVAALAQALEPLASSEGSRCVRAIERISEGNSSPPGAAVWSTSTSLSTGAATVEASTTAGKGRLALWLSVLAMAGLLAALAFWLVPSGGEGVPGVAPILQRSAALDTDRAAPAPQAAAPNGSPALEISPASVRLDSRQVTKTSGSSSLAAATSAGSPAGSVAVAKPPTTALQVKRPAQGASVRVRTRRPRVAVSPARPSTPDATQGQKKDPTRAWQRDAFGSRK